jgi:SNF2 family DNA or RNA helicase
MNSTSNLTSANHLIFFSPLLVKDQEQYDATMLQAIRRAHRFGQTKKVHIYRFVGRLSFR